MISDFYYVLFNEKTYHFAEVVTKAKKRTGNTNEASRWLQFSVNPIGDPEMPIFTSTPQLFNNISFIWENKSLQINSGVLDCTITLSGLDTNNTRYYQTAKEIQNVSFANVENGNYTLCITKPNYKPLIQKINVGTEYIQNETFTENVIFLSNDIYAGSHVTTTKPIGDVTIKPDASVTINATGNTLLGNGFTCEKGEILEIK